MFASYVALAMASLAIGVNAQAGPNTMAVYNPNLRTLSSNSTYFIVPIKTSTLQASVNYPLLPVQNAAVFPNGFPAGMHPLLVGYQYENDIRMSSLEIDSLMGAQVYVPYVDRLRDGKTPFLSEITLLIGGTNGQALSPIVPASVASLEGNPSFVGDFLPNTAAYSPLGQGQYSAQVKNVIVPNPISGPGVVPAVFDTLFKTASSSQYTAATFQGLVNEPLILTNGFCQNNVAYFNQTFNGGVLRTGTVTLYSGIIPAALAGVYQDVGGYSANPVQVSFNPQSCAAAAAALPSELA